MGDAIVAEWAAQARQHGDMKGSISTYVKAITIQKVTEDTVVVELPGRKSRGKRALRARMLEFGLGPSGVGSEGPFDVRRWLLTRQSPTARGEIKQGAAGPYRNVPFKLTSSAIKQLGGQSALDKARGLAPTRVRGGSWSGPSLARGYTEIVNNPNTRIPHKTDRLHGVRRMVGKSGGTSRFITFRRASWAGEPWMHRGVRARYIAKRVTERLPQIWKRVA
jgi:hypothetical protein